MNLAQQAMVFGGVVLGAGWLGQHQTAKAFQASPEALEARRFGLGIVRGAFILLMLAGALVLSLGAFFAWLATGDWHY